MNRCRFVALASLVCGLVCGFAHADPWLAPGDAGLRSDIQLLADAGILRTPVTSWPISWPDVARDVFAEPFTGKDEGVTAALIRVRRQARSAAYPGFAGLGVMAGAATDPLRERGFASSPREQGEIGMRASWLTDHLAINLQGTYAMDPADGKRFRADGSYLGINVGNFMVSAGLMERWWGPGWDGSLILSTNARPVPGITLERNYSDPFATRWLSWLGPWRASIALGEMEDDGLSVPRVRFLATRVNFRPKPWLEVGLSRTAQWCGGDRNCDWSTFVDMLTGRDNQVTEGGVADDQPGNQMAGYDLRLRSPWRALPVAVYTQWIGEDEAGGLPAKFLGLFGAEAWISTRAGSLRLMAEYADTTCNFTRQQPLYECAYRNSIYPQGYTHRGRPVGHWLDNDSRLFSAGAILSRANGDVASLTWRRMELNRDGGAHAISASPLDVGNVELRFSRPFSAGTVRVGVGYGDPGGPSDDDARFRGFVSWQQGF
jgi:hypothetical protein